MTLACLGRRGKGSLGRKVGQRQFISRLLVQQAGGCQSQWPHLGTLEWQNTELEGNGKLVEPPQRK